MKASTYSTPGGPGYWSCLRKIRRRRTDRRPIGFAFYPSHLFLALQGKLMLRLIPPLAGTAWWLAAVEATEITCVSSRSSQMTIV